jgi:hypothetical protein
MNSNKPGSMVLILLLDQARHVITGCCACRHETQVIEAAIMLLPGHTSSLAWFAEVRAHKILVCASAPHPVESLWGRGENMFNAPDVSQGSNKVKK